MPDTADAAERPASDAAVVAELTTELVVSYVTRNAVPAADIPALIITLHATLNSLGKPPQSDAPVQPLKPPVPIRKSIADDYLVSLEDGKPYKALKRHLKKLGMTPAEYRRKWGLPPDYPMVAPAYSRARSALAKETGLGSRLRRR